MIPAAGASRRLGSPKQLLKWGDSTLLSHALETAEELGQREIIVVLGAYYDRIRPELEDKSVRILQNKSWKNGLGSSISVGVEYLNTCTDNYDAVLIMLADQPLITPSYLKTMIERFRVDENQIIVTTYGKEKRGVPTIFGKKYFKELIGLTYDQGAQELIKRCAEFVITVDVQPEIADIDTEEDYNRIYKANHQ